MELEKACNLYVNNVRIIRQLSSISTDITLDEEEFYNEMVSNFKKIREYAAQIQEVLNNTLLPLLDGFLPLTNEEASILEGFIDELINGYSMQNLDLEIASKCMNKLINNSLENNDVEGYIKGLDNAITTYYTLMNKSERIYEHAHVKEHYRALGKEAADNICKYLSKDLFNTLSNDAKKLVLINNRYRSALHEAIYNNHEDNMAEIAVLKENLEMANDEFYINNINDFDWNVHKAAVYEYAGYMLERGNAKNLSVDEAKWVYDRIIDLKEIRSLSPLTKERVTDQEYSLLYIRAAYFSNNMSLEDYKNNLWIIYKRRKTGYNISSIFTNLLVPVEYLMILNKTGVTDKDKKNLERMYEVLIEYVISMPNSETLSYILEYFSLILDNFIEIEQMSFKDFALKAIASLHLPTFIHSFMVAKISKYIAGKYVELNPSILDVLKLSEDELLDYIYNAGLLHDVGKLPVIDTVYIYERRLFDTEFSVLKTHSLLGYNLLKKYESTKKYAKIAYSHHIWSNKTGGYPISIELNTLERFATDVIRCADCMDAATDLVGRSYSGGITLEQYAKEYKNGAGSLYAAYLSPLFTEERIAKHKDLLNKERKDSYYHAFDIIIKS